MTSHLKRRNGPSIRLGWTALRFSNSFSGRCCRAGSPGSWRPVIADGAATALLTGSLGLGVPSSGVSWSGLLIDFYRRILGDLHEVFTAPKRMDIGRKHLDRDRIEPPAPRRHQAVARGGDLADNLFSGPAIEPDC